MTVTNGYRVRGYRVNFLSAQVLTRLMPACMTLPSKYVFLLMVTTLLQGQPRPQLLQWREMTVFRSPLRYGVSLALVPQESVLCVWSTLILSTGSRTTANVRV